MITKNILSGLLILLITQNSFEVIADTRNGFYVGAEYSQHQDTDLTEIKSSVKYNNVAKLSIGYYLNSKFSFEVETFNLNVKLLNITPTNIPENIPVSFYGASGIYSIPFKRINNSTFTPKKLDYFEFFFRFGLGKINLNEIKINSSKNHTENSIYYGFGFNYYINEKISIRLNQTYYNYSAPNTIKFVTPDRVTLSLLGLGITYLI